MQYVSRTDHEREKAARRRILRNLAAGIADDDEPGYPHVPTFANWRKTQQVCEHCRQPWPCPAFERDVQAVDAALRAHFRQQGSYGHAATLAGVA